MLVTTRPKQRDAPTRDGARSGQLTIIPVKRSRLTHHDAHRCGQRAQQRPPALPAASRGRLLGVHGGLLLLLLVVEGRDQGWNDWGGSPVLHQRGGQLCGVVWCMHDKRQGQRQTGLVRFVGGRAASSMARGVAACVRAFSRGVEQRGFQGRAQTGGAATPHTHRARRQHHDADQLSGSLSSSRGR